MKWRFANKRQYDITDYGKHSHDYWEVIYQISGSADVFINGEKSLFEQGDVMILPPYTMHYAVSDGSFRDLYFQTEQLDFQGATIVHDYTGDILILMNLLYKMCNEKTEKDTRIFDSLVDVITLYLKKTEKHYKYSFLYQIQDGIHANLSDSDFSIPELCDKIGYNIDYVRRCFKEETGTTPLQYLIRLRLQKAKKLLEQERFLDIQEISLECGFCDSFYFSKLFKKQYALSPSEYRKKFFANGQ